MNKHTYTDDEGEWTAATRLETALLGGAAILLCALLGLLGWVIWG